MRATSAGSPIGKFRSCRCPPAVQPHADAVAQATAAPARWSAEARNGLHLQHLDLVAVAVAVDAPGRVDDVLDPRHRERGSHVRGEHDTAPAAAVEHLLLLLRGEPCNSGRISVCAGWCLRSPTSRDSRSSEEYENVTIGGQAQRSSTASTMASARSGASPVPRLLDGTVALLDRIQPPDT
jgi:hypothetical protein